VRGIDRPQGGSGDQEGDAHVLNIDIDTGGTMTDGLVSGEDRTDAFPRISSP